MKFSTLFSKHRSHSPSRNRYRRCRRLAEAGVPPFGIKAAEQQLRHLGRRRADRLYDWLLEARL